MQSKKILTIEDSYVSLDNNQISIPKLDIYENQFSGILSLEDKNLVLGKTFHKFLQNEGNLITFYNHIDNGYLVEKQTKINFNNAKILENLAFLSLDSNYHLSKNLPILNNIDQLSKTVNQTNSNSFEINETIRSQKFFVKNILGQLMLEPINKLKTELMMFKPNLEKFEFNISQALQSVSKKRIAEVWYEFKNEQKEFLTKVMTHIFSVLNVFYMYFDIILSKTRDFLNEEKITELEKELFWVQKLNKDGQKKIELELKIRDAKSKIFELEKILKLWNQASSEKLDYLMKWYSKSLLNDLARMYQFPKDTKSFKTLYKLATVKEALLKSFTKVDRSLLVGPIEVDDIEKLKEDLDMQIKFFIANNLSTVSLNSSLNFEADVKKIVKNNFSISLYGFLTSWKVITEEIKDQVITAKKEIKNIQSHFVDNSITNDYSPKVRELSIKISELKAEREFLVNSAQERYRKFSKENKQFLLDFDNLGYLFKEPKQRLNIILNRLKTQYEHCQTPFETLNNKSLSDVIQENNEYIESVSLLFNWLVLLRDFVTQETDLTIDQQIQLRQLFLLSKITSTSGIEPIKFITPFYQLDYIGALNIDFSSILIEKKKIVFIIDSAPDTFFNEKKTFLNAFAKKLTDAGMSCIFISNDTYLMKHLNLSELYVFVDQKEIEFGNYETLISNPFNPWLRYPSLKNIKNSKDLLHSFADDYLFYDIYEVNDDQYVIGNLANFKVWNKKIKTDQIDFTLSDDTKDTNTENIDNNLENPFNETMFMIADLHNSEYEFNYNWLDWTTNFAKQWEAHNSLEVKTKEAESTEILQDIY
ncbi:MAG1360 family OppF-related protein [Mycoplasmopsis columbinasalis]|uniref:Uncharacterized protein n=1 Tax=Mycoplasmopsis columbinasalis TaxID=114880 RepID=A0A449BAL1_9BACT|nr:hypothetical protein [Mycoplasmopsis columbinasalis]VEU78235.1 Uncharacterised protein [Mycoplasmopsis columbinasalis]